MKRIVYVVLSLFLFSSFAYAVPKFLNYQGKLSDATGAPVANGTYQITFSIYDVSTGGTALWTETLNVPVTNGVFAVELGKVTVMPATLISAPSLFLGVKVGSDPEMTPRSPLHPVPRAFLSEKAEDADKLGGKLPGEFVLKIDPKWNVLSNEDGAINNADSQHTHTVGSVSGTVLLNPSATQTIQSSGNFPPLAVKMIAGQTSPLIELINDAGTVMGSISSRGLSGKGGLDLLAEGPAPTLVSVSNPDATNVANLDVEGTVTAQKLSLLSDPRWNLLTNQDGVVDNADTMHTHSGGGGGGAVLLAPTTPQIIQSGLDLTPLIIKPGIAAPTTPIFVVRNFSDVTQLMVSPGGNLLVGNPSDPKPKLGVEFNSLDPSLATKQLGSGTALDVWNAGTGPAGVFSITDASNSQPLIKGDHGGSGNLLQLSKGGINKFVVDNTGTITVGGVNDPNAVKTNPSGAQTIQPSADVTALAVKAGVASPTKPMFEVLDFSGVQKLAVMPDGHVFIPSGNKLHVLNLDNDSPTGPMGNMTIDAINNLANSQVSITNSNASFTADLSVEGNATIGTGLIASTVNLNTKTAAGNTEIFVQNPGGGIADLKVEGLVLMGASAIKAVGSPLASQQMIQSGKNCEAVTTDGFVTITFATPFTSAPNVFGTLDKNNTGTTASGVFILNSPVDVTSTAVTFRIVTASSTDTECVFWIAIGGG